MIKIYCQDGDEGMFSRCISYRMNADNCSKYENICDNCPYYDVNIQFIQHNSERIIIETDEIDLDIGFCLYNTHYNYLGCGMVDLSKKENCEQCRFFYDNIEIKEETK